MGWGSAYIPDLTERFPEGFGGVDLTDSYYPSFRGLPDPWAYLDEEYGEDIPFEADDRRHEEV